MRLFAALLPPPASLDELAGAIEPHLGGWPGLRWLPRENWHVTLAFYGEVPEQVLPGLRVRLARAASRYEPMTFAFAGTGAFPSARRGRVFWCGLSGPRDPLSRLADSLAAAGRRAGVQMGEPKRFRPHLTLARARADVDVRELVAVLDAFAGTPWEVTEIHLVRSHLGAHVRYETLESWPLGRRAPGPGARRDRGGGRSRERGSGGSGERGSGGSTAEGG